jgi:predicted secreted hydrolase
VSVLEGRLVLLMALLPVWFSAARAAPPDYPPVLPGKVLAFPRDHGAHPDFRTEWWYATGWLETEGEARRPLGFQVTFFRSRPPVDQANPSRFSPRQLLFAHAALSDPGSGRLRHDQRAARAGFGLAAAKVGDTDVHIDDWSLRRGANGVYRARIPARDFNLELDLRPTQPHLLQGKAGFSRKGPLPRQASYYYSQPQLAVGGSIVRAGRREAVRGTAWLDHEWSSEILARNAVGWDWTGLNLDDGGALMAFRMRDRAGATVWAGGSFRDRNGHLRVFGPGDVEFIPLRRWRSPHSGTEYPVAVRLRAGGLRVDLQPLLDDQELDSGASTGAIYWEGAVTALASGNRTGQRMGRGYLELTGYGRPLDL